MNRWHWWFPELLVWKNESVCLGDSILHLTFCNFRQKQTVKWSYWFPEQQQQQQKFFLQMLFYMLNVWFWKKWQYEGNLSRNAGKQMCKINKNLTGVQHDYEYWATVNIRAYYVWIILIYNDYVFLKQNMSSSFKRVTLQTKIFGVGGFSFTLFVSFLWTYITAGTWQNNSACSLKTGFFQMWTIFTTHLCVTLKKTLDNERLREMFSWLALTPETYVTLSTLITTFPVLQGILCLSESSDALRYCRKAVNSKYHKNKPKQNTPNIATTSSSAL